ncbi:MAG: hypothetical protein ABI794_00045 [Betaproteobacteria bacterium]
MTQHLKSRRKIVTAGIAAPLILTVRPSSATALASNRCMEKDALKPPPSNILCDTPDEWMRWQTQPCELTVKVNNKMTKLTGRRFIRNITGSCYYELDKYSPNTVTPKTCSYVPGAPGVVENIPSGTGMKYCLVKINTAGVPCAYNWETSVGAQKCTNSCWTSLRPR